MNECFKKRKPPRPSQYNSHKITNKILLRILQIFKPFLRKGRVEKSVAKEYISLLQQYQLETTQKLHASRVYETLQKIQNNDGELSVDKFWILKKCISKKTDERSSIITDQNVEVFDDDAVLNEYMKEFKCRLAHRQICPELKHYQDLTHSLLNIYLADAANCSSKQDFTKKEVADTMRSLKCGTAPGPDMFPPDIFFHGGTELVNNVTQVMNNIKNNLVIPDSWIDVIIVTLFKNKGSKKMLKNHRGIILSSVLSKIMEKLIKMRIQGKLDCIESTQYGARINRSTCDNIFIINSLIDHAKYLNRTLYITLYDYSTCFDSLWLEDCMLSLWNLGIKDEFLPLIFKINNSSRVTVRTPHGYTNPFNCNNIVKQGAVLSTSICGSSTGELNQNLSCNGANVLNEIIKSFLFVDDTTTVNTDVNNAIQSHNDVIYFTKKKRLQLNETKCVQVIINKKPSDIPPLLMVNDRPIECVQSTKYLGDIISANGSNSNLVCDRVRKGKAVTVSILSLSNQTTLGHHSIRTSLILYKSVFIPSVLFNAQAWSNITVTQINQLRATQLKVLKRIMCSPNSTPNAFTFLELGILPIEYEIHQRQLTFLHHIVTLPSNDPVFKLYQQQKLLTFEKNWANNTLCLLWKYSLNGIDVAKTSKNEWKLIVKSSIRATAFVQLKEECKNKTKTYSLKYNSFQPQKYISTCQSNHTSLLFKIRARCLNCRDNHHHASPIITCRLCDVDIENQDHIINCPKVRHEGQTITLKQFYTQDFETNQDQLHEIHARYTTFLNLASISNNT